MTGEINAKRKVPIELPGGEKNPCPFALKSTLIESGNGKAIVCAVGPLTYIGKTEDLLLKP